MESEKAFLGVGWAFPPQAGARGDVEMAVYEKDIQQSIQIILGTKPGERVMRPDFGAGLYRLVFEPISATTTELVKHHVEEALILWEPRIDGVTVRVSADPPHGRLLIDIGYRVRATNAFYNLVYPFYLQEGRVP
jgi:phage baseplate assembly protein W